MTKVRRGNVVTYTLADPSVAQMLTAARSFLVHRLGHTSGALADLAGNETAGATPDLAMDEADDQIRAAR